MGHVLQKEEFFQGGQEMWAGEDLTEDGLSVEVDSAGFFQETVGSEV